MTGIVTSISRSGLDTLGSIASASYEKLNVEAPSREVIRLGVMIVILQILDGVFTATGVQHYGTAVEANIIIRHLMEVFGPAAALLLVKSMAIAIVGMLCLLSSRVTWLPNAMRAVAGVYIGAAILPWSWVLLNGMP